ncbi:hypothetical protein M433DRAFT_5433 [Acidomyces richmondensis BFW]|nr:MAG: hypothetical protein FE78DRAFT_33334 [Acidomyces sp. 'richmondensis']KYG44468.1 hypothetical protein M433DRAFT_5433 [Acidomyces richmondensis BFW]
MAEVDNRRDNRAGGGYAGGRGHNKRKRGRDDDEFDTSYGYRNQRPRQEAPPGTRIRRGLLEIAEDQLRAPREVVQNLARLAADNYEDDYVKDTFGNVALKLVVEQPLKIPFVAATVLYANAENSAVAKDILDKAGEELQAYLECGEWRGVKLMLRFLSVLSPLYKEDGVFSILDELFNRAVDLQTASQDDSVGIELVKIILLTIPYILAFAKDETREQRAMELLEKTEIVATTPHPMETLVDPYSGVRDDEERPMSCSSVLSMLQRQLQDEAANGWPLQCIPRVYDSDVSRVAAMNGDASAEANGGGESKVPQKHAFPTVTVPSPVCPGSKLLFPELYFSLYADQEVESVPPTSNIASSLLRDVILDTVNLLDFNRNAAARLLNEVDCFWAKDTFVKRSTAFDKLRDMQAAGKPSWKPEDVVIDAVFSQIFQLPAPEHKLVYYHSLITESCKISPGAIAPCLGRAIRFLFRNVDVMDMELAYRYMDWFAHHLSNFEFRWKWTEWIPELELSDLHPKKAFIIGALDKEIQLSFAKRVRDTLPDPYKPLISQSKEEDTPPFKYNNDGTQYAQQGREVLSLLKKKSPESDIQLVLDAVHKLATEDGTSDPLIVSTDIYMTAICSIGSKSLSHVLSTIDRCKERLLAVGNQSEAARRQIISSVVDFWTDHPGTAVNIVDKLLNYTIVTPMSVIQWALHDRLDGGRALASSQIYELISITMFKVTNRVRQVLRERNNLALPFSQRQQIDEALPRERQGMRDLFAAIEEYIAAVTQGIQDETLERYDGPEEEQQLIQMWAARWARVWRRKAAVEETVVGDAAVQPLEEPAQEQDVVGSTDQIEDLDQLA